MANQLTISDIIDQQGYNQTCYDCVYYHEWQEHHPYGMGTAAETLCECRASEDSDCPRIQAIKETASC